MTTKDTARPEALSIAEVLEQDSRGRMSVVVHGLYAVAAAAELRRQHAKIADLQAQLEAVGAGGVSALMGAAQAQPVGSTSWIHTGDRLPEPAG